MTTDTVTYEYRHMKLGRDDLEGPLNECGREGWRVIHIEWWDGARCWQILLGRTR